MPNDAKADISRANGAKSKGPVTPEGKEKSSQNARKHGLTARKSAVVNPREIGEYQRYHDSVFESLKPQNAVEATFADLVAQSAWRLRGLADIEADYMRHNLEGNRRTYQAFTYCQAAKEFQVLGRYRAAIERTLNRALKSLKDLQTQTPRVAQILNLQNEPSV